MGSKAWRNLGAMLLASAALAGCNNGPGPLGGLFGGPQPVRTTQTTPNQFGATASGQAGQPRPGAFPTQPGANSFNPAGTAGNAFNNPNQNGVNNFNSGPGGINQGGFSDASYARPGGGPSFPAPKTPATTPGYVPFDNGRDPFAPPSGSSPLPATPPAGFMQRNPGS